ncbi:hypothetical protein L6452_27293 [Arctium lappa]|uniref:Uncharacterized protein n=1 Tax=Arctium lappa TaxID=4217 RepID=A0ACB8ZVX0_ARCLA|nr:hypothetical protein L6452_27293 [Arctium lappa]
MLQTLNPSLIEKAETTTLASNVTLRRPMAYFSVLRKLCQYAMGLQRNSHSTTWGRGKKAAYTLCFPDPTSGSSRKQPLYPLVEVRFAYILPSPDLSSVCLGYCRFLWFGLFSKLMISVIAMKALD